MKLKTEYEYEWMSMSIMMENLSQWKTKNQVEVNAGKTKTKNDGEKCRWKLKMCFEYHVRVKCEYDRKFCVTFYFSQLVSKNFELCASKYKLNWEKINKF